MATFIGTSPEMFYTHFFPPCRPSLPFFGRKLDDFILILADSRLNFSRGLCPIGSSTSCKQDAALRHQDVPASIRSAAESLLRFVDFARKGESEADRITAASAKPGLALPH